MAYSAVPTVINGDSWTAGNQNTYVRDNFKAGIPDIFNAAGQIAYATGANGATNLAIGTTRERLLVNSAGSAPEWRGIIGCSLGISGTFRFYYYYTGLPDKVIWDTANYNTDGLWNDASPEAVIIPYTGIYKLSGFINYVQVDPPDYTSYLRVIVGPNDMEIRAGYMQLAMPVFPFEYVGKFTAGDDVYLRVSLYSGTGGKKKATGTTYIVTYLGPES